MYGENRGRVFYFTLNYRISSRPVVSPFICACSAQSLSSFSHRAKYVRSPQCSLLFKRLACLSCPWCARLPTSCSFIRNFFLHESFARNKWIRSIKPHLIENATQRPEVDSVQRGVGRIQVKKICGFNDIGINVDEAFSLTWTAATYIYWNKKQVGVVRDTNMRWCDVI